MKLADDSEHINLIINTYITLSFKKPDRSVDLRKFVEEVYSIFQTNDIKYSKTDILTTWKDLVEDYYYYKKNFTSEYASNAWNFFSLMDRCFDPKDTSKKFNSTLTFYLIDCMSNHRDVIAKKGLTSTVLSSVENDFKELGNNDINQSDIYIQWEILKQSFRESRLLIKQRCRNIKLNEFYDAMRIFYQSPSFHASKNYNGPVKRRNGADRCEGISKKMDVKSDDVDRPFNTELKEQLLIYIKSKKNKLGFNKELTPSFSNYIVEEFKKIGYNFTAEAINNEWNDLYYRYELLKSSEKPYNWKFFSEINDICNHTESVVVESIENSTYLEKLTAMDDNNCSKKYSDIPELRELMLENNLSGEEVTYLLNSIET
ncbi:uncharacterized protein LOC126884643 [Diabrotica virgifera virgifera]|uniref:MADF domain-containing protein n=1 Tax=Diabrotica virgifera virgifera TaxID=50390 RepID=A0ABM5K8Z8_DIAVI|nr:uncharacterized protein LOC126884643 [Diabrotica virgifera virgifera]